YEKIELGLRGPISLGQLGLTVCVSRLNLQLRVVRKTFWVLHRATMVAQDTIGGLVRLASQGTVRLHPLSSWGKAHRKPGSIRRPSKACPSDQQYRQTRLRRINRLSKCRWHCVWSSAQWHINVTCSFRASRFSRRSVNFCP